MDNNIVYSEIFRSLQGEGKYTGAPSIWIRLFMCQLQCDGFGQLNPKDPSTYELPYKDFDINSISKIEDLPVWNKGCDSSYTWSKKYKHLMHQESASDIVDKLESYLPNGKWENFHFCITGGEPLLRQNQKSCVMILEEMYKRDNFPKYITIETNSVEVIGDNLEDTLIKLQHKGTEVFMSLSPKLYNVSGEKPERAINLESIRTNAWLADDYQLKFVLDDKKETWDEMEELLLSINKGILLDVVNKEKVWIMPVSATVEGQQEIASKVADIATARGYNVAARVHCYIYGNKIGT